MLFDWKSVALKIAPAEPMSWSEAKRRRVTCLGLAMGFLVLYGFTLFPGVGGVTNHGDSAKFQFLGVVPGVGHAPGNPLYLALLALVQQLPFGTPAARANGASALCAAAAILLIADAAYRLASVRAAVTAGLVLGLGALYWQFATEAEVYALNALFVAFIVRALVRAEQEQRPRMLALAAAAFALGVSNHLSLAFALPALLAAAIRLVRQGVVPRLRDGVPVLCCAGVTLLLYALLPLLHHYSVYSEYQEVAPGFKGFIEFVTAAKWQSQLGASSLKRALNDRSIATATMLLRQWTLLLWGACPLAGYALLRRAPAVGLFCALAALSWIGFLFLYDIPDPDGLVVPVACALALPLGVAVESARRPIAALAFGALALTPTAVLHFRQARRAVGFEVLQDTGSGPQQDALDLPDIISRMPAHSYLTIPCEHYGCVQVANYFRFADPAARERDIGIVSLTGGHNAPWPSSPPPIEAQLARTAVVCTVHADESELLKAAGARVQIIERGNLRIRRKERVRLPLFCSQPP